MTHAPEEIAFLKTLADICAIKGFTESAVEDAMNEHNISSQDYGFMFPNGRKDIAKSFSKMIDAEMMTVLNHSTLVPERIRNKVSFAVKTRLNITNDMEEMVRECAKFWSIKDPVSGGSSLWTTADLIWSWAGDQSTDYNYYTKRGLLSGVLLSTTIFWLNDKSPDKSASIDFLEKRIDNVLTFGRFIGKPMKKIASLFTCRKKTLDTMTTDTAAKEKA